MLKKVLIGGASFLALLAVLTFVFRADLQAVIVASMVEDMFLESDTDDFEPGFAGERFPRVEVVYRGEELADLTGFSGSRGLVVLFSRSVVW
tara:strand:+ start:146 stop:421 length:276 start_codon:yes stop_codon:yes gene_type:complete